MQERSASLEHQRLRTLTFAVLLAAGAAGAGYWLGGARQQPVKPEGVASLPQEADALMMQAMAPGSTLGCLDRPLSGALEFGCEKALFGTPASVVAALSYVEARLLQWRATVGTVPANQAHLRAAFAADRFGFVAQVLADRGCTALACHDLALFPEGDRLSANLDGRLFEANLAMHAPSWSRQASPDSPQVAAVPGPGQPIGPEASTMQQSASGPAPINSRYDFPSSASIPAVSIMTAEPPAPPPPSDDAAASKPAQPARRAAPREPPAR